ncbi:MAG TPA: hypothetical protein VGM37_16540 [Armatimonadota bacterium]
MPLATEPVAERHAILLNRVAESVARYDDRPPGGALLGPRLLFMAALGRLPDDRLVHLGAAVELLRRATLVHRAPTEETAWRGEGGARFSQTLRGDSLLAESFRLLAADGEPRTVGLLSRAMAGVAGGELERHEHGGTAEAARRLAAFYAGAAATGALVAGLSDEESAAYTAFGWCVGEVHARRRWGVEDMPCAPCADPPRGAETLAALAMDAAGQLDVV